LAAASTSSGVRSTTVVTVAPPTEDLAVAVPVRLRVLALLGVVHEEEGHDCAVILAVEAPGPLRCSAP
jgi:hypothetical protein